MGATLHRSSREKKWGICRLENRRNAKEATETYWKAQWASLRQAWDHSKSQGLQEASTSSERGKSLQGHTNLQCQPTKISFQDRAPHWNCWETIKIEGSDKKMCVSFHIKMTREKHLGQIPWNITREKKKREYKTNNILTEVKIYQKDMPIKQFKTVAYYVIQ